MQDLITNYEQCRLQLQNRIHELNAMLRNASLPTKEREALTARRDLLTVERTELLSAINDMRKHVKGVSYETCLRKVSGIRPRSDS